MRRVLLSLAAGVLGLSLTGAAQAHDVDHGHRHTVVRRAYYETHGRHFTGGYYFVGRSHHHWSRQVWDVTYHRTQYYDPDLRCWYYWYAPGNCYYPVSYCP